MVDWRFLPQNFGHVVRTYEGLLPFCECTAGGGSICRWWGYLNTKCHNQTLNFLHREVVGSEKLIQTAWVLGLTPRTRGLAPTPTSHLVKRFHCLIFSLSGTITRYNLQYSFLKQNKIYLYLQEKVSWDH